MNYFDLHCDTLSACFDKGQRVEHNDLQFAIDRTCFFDRVYQTFAIFVHDRYQKIAAEKRFCDIYSVYQETDFSKVKPILAIENGVALGGKIENVRRYRDMGIRLMTLTWNAENELGGGASTDIGLSNFGKSAVCEMEKCGMIVDVSHLSNRAFWDVAKVATKPFIATHSNSKAVCNHRRNLDDEQIKTIISFGGIIGLNLYPVFLSCKNKANFNDIFRHIEHFLSVGAEDHLALGTDFDGADMMPEWDRVEKMPAVYQKISEKFGENTANKIFYENAKKFFDKYVKLG